MILSPIIILAEVLLGLLLILLINPKRSSMFSFFLLIIFTIFFAYAHYKNGINDCGCFGTLQPADIPPSITFIRNFILLFMSFIVWMKYPSQKKDKIAVWKKTLIVAFLCPAIFISGFTFRLPQFLAKHPGRQKYLNQSILTTDLSKYVKISPEKKYLLFYFTYTCPHCWNSIENLHQFEKSAIVDSVFGFAYGEKDDEDFFIQNFHPDFTIKNLPLDEFKKLVDVVPTAFYVEHDTIKVILQSALPSPITFAKYFLSGADTTSGSLHP